MLGQPHCSVPAVKTATTRKAFLVISKRLRHCSPALGCIHGACRPSGARKPVNNAAGPIGSELRLPSSNHTMTNNSEPHESAAGYAQELLGFLAENRQSLAPLLILPHDYPDPDALAAAFTLHFLARGCFLKPQTGRRPWGHRRWQLPRGRRCSRRSLARPAASAPGAPAEAIAHLHQRRAAHALRALDPG